MFNVQCPVPDRPVVFFPQHGRALLGSWGTAIPQTCPDARAHRAPGRPRWTLFDPLGPASRTRSSLSVTPVPHSAPRSRTARLERAYTTVAKQRVYLFVRILVTPGLPCVGRERGRLASCWVVHVAERCRSPFFFFFFDSGKHVLAD